MDLDIKCKATLLAAVFLIVSVIKISDGSPSTRTSGLGGRRQIHFKDFMFFEKPAKKSKKRRNPANLFGSMGPSVKYSTF